MFVSLRAGGWRTIPSGFQARQSRLVPSAVGDQDKKMSEAEGISQRLAGGVLNWALY